MKRWAKMVSEGQERVDDVKTKTIRALDNLFAGGFMQESTDDKDMLPVLRKFLMNDFEGYSPPRAQVPAALLDDFANFGEPEALTAPSLDDTAVAFEAGGANLTGWGRERIAPADVDEQMSLLRPLDREQFSQAVQSGLEEMEVGDIDMVFDEIDKDGDGALTLEELYETYKTVQAELVTEQEMEEAMSLWDAESAAKLRPETPDAAFSKLIPGGETWNDDGALQPAETALSERMQGWEEVCQVLSTQSAYLPRAGQMMVQEAVELTGNLLLSDSADGSSDFGDGLSLGGIVAGLQSQSEAVTAAVLLPSLRRGAVGQGEIREQFGPVVASIVEDSLWLSKLPESVGLLDDDGSRFLREYMVAVSRDHRAVVVMLADRLHSLRRVRNAPLYEQHLRALEALQVYSPLAHALGVGKWLWELEDLSFRALFPDSYADVEQWQLDLWEESGAMMEEAKGKVLASLNENPLLTANVQRYAITSRRKSLFSTFKKMYQKNKNLEGIKDVFAMRIVIGLNPEQRGNEEMQVRVCLEAYQALRAALPDYSEGARRFKDYASKPKPNGYQSVHTTLNTPSGLPVEIQIRTEEMHAAAEFGDAAHNLYKGGIKSLSSAQKFADSVRKSNAAVLVPDDEDSCFSSTLPSDLSSDGAVDETAATNLEYSESGSQSEGAGRDDEAVLHTTPSSADLEELKERGAGDDYVRPVQPEVALSAQEDECARGNAAAAADIDASLRAKERPPSLGAALRLKLLGQDNALSLRAASLAGAGLREGTKFPTIMQAPSVGSEAFDDSLVGDSWQGESMGQDLFVMVSSVVAKEPPEDAALGIDVAEEERSALSLVLEEMEREAWRDVAAALQLQPPRDITDETVMREGLRRQGARIIERSERLRMLLDTSLGRLFDTRQEAEKAADKFGLIYEPDYDFYSDDASFDQSAYSDEVAEAVASASREIDDTPPAIEASASVSREIDLSRSE